MSPASSWMSKREITESVICGSRKSEIFEIMGKSRMKRKKEEKEEGL